MLLPSFHSANVLIFSILACSIKLNKIKLWLIPDWMKLKNVTRFGVDWKIHMLYVYTESSTRKLILFIYRKKYIHLVFWRTVDCFFSDSVKYDYNCSSRNVIKTNKICPSIHIQDQYVCMQNKEKQSCAMRIYSMQSNWLNKSERWLQFIRDKMIRTNIFWKVVNYKEKYEKNISFYPFRWH